MTFEEAENRAEEIAKKYNSEGLAPFPFEEIEQGVEDLHIYVSDKLSEKMSGAIIYDKEKELFSILINKDKPQTRQYFTIAHELGHYFLHKPNIISNEGLIDGEDTLDGAGGVLFRQDEVASTKMEREANRFAASLIMPRNLVEKVWNELKNIERCAEVFKVSAVAMSIRLDKLGLLGQ